jgi:hypothetical protein
MQKKPQTYDEVIACGVEAIRAAWFSTYILKTVDVVQFLAANHPLDTLPAHLWEGAWESCSASSPSSVCT